MLRSGLWLGHCNTYILVSFSPSVADLKPCLGTIVRSMSRFGPNFSLTSVFISSYKGPVAPDQAQTFIPPIRCLTAGLRSSVLYSTGKHLCLGLIRQEDIVPDVLFFWSQSCYHNRIPMVNFNLPAYRLWDGASGSVIITLTVRQSSDL